MFRLGTKKFRSVAIINEIIYFVLVIIFILELFVISTNQSQTYLEFKFDDSALSCRLISDGINRELEVEAFIRCVYYILLRYLATATIGNGLQCKLPYQFNGNSSDICFCPRFMGLLDWSSYIKNRYYQPRVCVCSKIFI